MSKLRLKNPPLIEVILEVRWELKESTPIGKRDPHYQFLLGVFHEKTKEEYPYHEELPTSRVPDEVTGGVVKHRFRTGENDWPLIQIGPGVMTVNETKKYDTFDSFNPRALAAVEFLFESYPNSAELNIIDLQLRYINAYEFDYTEEKVQEFISQQMHVKSELPSFFLENKKIEQYPVSYATRTSLRCNEPPGVVSLWIDTGHKLKKRAIIWKHMFQSTNEDVPNMPDDFSEWLQQAHDIIHIGFDGIIKGSLEGEFNK